jgi:nucleoid-associated protein YgaU
MVRIFDEDTEEVLCDTWLVALEAESVVAETPRDQSTAGQATAGQSTAGHSTAAQAAAASAAQSTAAQAAAAASPPPPPPAPPKAPPKAPPAAAASFDKTQTFGRIQRHLNIGWLSLTAYESMFGEITSQEPWGRCFWDGMSLALAQYRFPKYDLPPRQQGYYETPMDFSKANALRAKSRDNPGSNKLYATYIWTWQEEVHVACQWMLLAQGRPWKMHSSWLSQVVDL